MSAKNNENRLMYVKVIRRRHPFLRQC